MTEQRFVNVHVPTSRVERCQPVGHASPPGSRAGQEPLSRRAEIRRSVRRVRSALLPVLDAVESVVDPLVRPGVAAAQRRRGGRDAQDLLEHYRSGAYLSVGRWGRSVWCEPRRRAIIPIAERKVPKNIARLIRAGRFEVTFDSAFPDVVGHCATVRDRSTAGRPWLTAELQLVYLRLHELGYAHSVEVWRDGRLVGGEMGVAVAGLYSGESMFFLETNASKVGLAALTERLQARGFHLFDTQVMTAVGQQFGAYWVSREEYRARLCEAVTADTTFDCAGDPE